MAGLFLHSLSDHLSTSGADKWSPALQIRTVLLSIQALMGAPNPDDPLSNDVAQHWKSDERAAIQQGKWNTRSLADALDNNDVMSDLSCSPGVDHEICHQCLELEGRRRHSRTFICDSHKRVI